MNIVEIKKPDLTFWTKPDAHGNLCPKSELTSAITQCLNYLYDLEMQCNSVDFLERVNETRTVKPQCMLIYGRSNNWGEAEHKAYRIQIKITTGINIRESKLNVVDKMIATAKIINCISHFELLVFSLLDFSFFSVFSTILLSHSKNSQQ